MDVYQLTKLYHYKRPGIIGSLVRISGGDSHCLFVPVFTFIGCPLEILTVCLCLCSHLLDVRWRFSLSVCTCAHVYWISGEDLHWRFSLSVCARAHVYSTVVLFDQLLLLFDDVSFCILLDMPHLVLYIYIYLCVYSFP